MTDTLRDIWRQFRREPMRTFLTLFGIVLGSASIVFLGSSLPAASSALARMSQDATGDDITQVYERGVRNLSRARTFRSLSGADARAMAAQEKLPVRNAAAMNERMSQEATRGAKRVAVGVQGGGTAYMKLQGLELEHGRWLADAEEGERVTVIGNGIWQSLFDGQWPLEDNTFVLNGASALRVVGVVKSRPPISGGGGDGTWMYDRKIWVSSATFRYLIDPRLEFGEIAMRHVIGADGALPDLKSVAERLTPFLEKLHLGVRNFEFRAMNQGFQLWMLVTYAIGAIMFASGLVSMVVGGINVMNAQLVRLHEKTKEYGIRRTLGLSAGGLMQRVLVEASLYTLSGGILGVGLGLTGAFCVSWALTRWLGYWPFAVVPWSLAVALGSSVLVGVLAGLLPARRAKRLVPSECLRAE
jgi:putative ABC transport system permease protein